MRGTEQLQESSIMSAAKGLALRKRRPPFHSQANRSLVVSGATALKPGAMFSARILAFVAYMPLPSRASLPWKWLNARSLIDIKLHRRLRQELPSD